MDRRQILLILLLELWHLETMCACAILVIMMMRNFRRNQIEIHSIENRSLIRHDNRLRNLHNRLGNDAECVSELRTDRKSFGILCDLFRMVEESNIDANFGGTGDKHDTSLSSRNEGSQSINRSNKRKRGSSSATEDNIVMAMEKLFEVSGKMMQMVTDAIIKGNENRSDIAKELKAMGFSPLKQIAALKIILEKPSTISMFMSLDEDIKKVFVEQLLLGNV